MSIPDSFWESVKYASASFSMLSGVIGTAAKTHSQKTDEKGNERDVLNAWGRVLLACAVVSGLIALLSQYKDLDDKRSEKLSAEAKERSATLYREDQDRQIRELLEKSNQMNLYMADSVENAKRSSEIALRSSIQARALVSKMNALNATAHTIGRGVEQQSKAQFKQGRFLGQLGRSTQALARLSERQASLIGQSERQTRRLLTPLQPLTVGVRLRYPAGPSTPFWDYAKRITRGGVISLTTRSDQEENLPIHDKGKGDLPSAEQGAWNLLFHPQFTIGGDKGRQARGATDDALYIAPSYSDPDAYGTATDKPPHFRFVLMVSVDRHAPSRSYLIQSVYIDQPVLSTRGTRFYSVLDLTGANFTVTTYNDTLGGPLASVEKLEFRFKDQYMNWLSVPLKQSRDPVFDRPVWRGVLDKRDIDRVVDPE